MALSANTVFEVRTTGSDSNGGGFVTGASGTDRSQQNGAQATLTTASVVAATTTNITVSVGDYTVSATDVGNILQITGGTATAGFYQITAVNTGTNTWTLDRSAGTAAQTVVGKMGGALLSPAVAVGAATVSGQIVYIQYTAGTPYTITTASTNVAGGCLSGTSGTYIVGYDTSRSLYAPFQNRPTLQLSGVSAATVLGNLNATYSAQSLIIDCNAQTTSIAFKSSGEAFYVKAMNFRSAGIVQNLATLRVILCEATGGSAVTQIISATIALWCVAHDNAQTLGNTGAFSATTYAFGCVAYGNGEDGFSGSGGTTWVNCIAYNNSQRGFYLGNIGGTLSQCINCISENNGAAGYFTNSGLGALINCADYNNTGGRKNSASLWAADINPIVGSGSFFQNAASQDFRLNNASGGGALCRAAGFPAKLPEPSTATTNFRDICATQHLEIIAPTIALGV